MDQSCKIQDATDFFFMRLWRNATQRNTTASEPNAKFPFLAICIFNSCPWRAKRSWDSVSSAWQNQLVLVGLRAAVGGTKVRIGHDSDAATYLPTYNASPFSDKSIRAVTKDSLYERTYGNDPTEPSRTRAFPKQIFGACPAVAAALATPPHWLRWFLSS